jgi:hypothetical protein
MFGRIDWGSEGCVSCSGEVQIGGGEDKIYTMEDKTNSMSELTLQESKELLKFELVESHKTFEDYCKERWGISRGEAYRQIGAASVVEDLAKGQNIILPTAISQTRALQKLKTPEERRKAWEKAGKISNGAVTAEVVEKVVEGVLKNEGKPASGSGVKGSAAPKVDIKGDKATVETKGTEGIETLQDLVAYCNIDLDVWECTSFRHSTWDGKIGVRAEFVRIKGKQEFADILKTFIEKAAAHSPQEFIYKKPNAEADSFYILSIVDPHFGKLAESQSTGYEDYKIEIAKDYYRKTVDDLLNGADLNRVKKIGLIVASDAIHIENERMETSSGTRIDGDSRWHKIFDDTCSLMVETVERLAAQFEVEVIVIPGNHSRLTEYAMGAYIKSYFRKHENVSVDNRPLPRKYFSYGKTLVGICHGDGVRKLEDLGAVLFRENLETLSNHKHFYYLSGHRHRFGSVIDDRGVRIFVSGAICPPDKWHSEGNMTGAVQSAEGYMFSAENGLSQIVFSKPLNKK